MELYSHLTSKMPPSAPVADNDTGDFFKSMLKLAAPLISEIFPPAAPLVMAGLPLADAGINAISGAVKNARLKKATQKAPVKTPVTPARKAKLTRKEIHAEIARLQSLLASL